MEQLNRAMRMIEDGLVGELNIAAVARAAWTTEHHLRRMFSALAGMPLSEYVRRRRLTVAAAAVVRGDEAIQDIAVRFGYSSADAFSRAFREVHGVGPDAARRPGAVLHSQPPVTFHLTILGSKPMEYRLVTLDAFRVVGVTARVPLIYEGVNPHIAAVHESMGDADWMALHELGDTEPSGVIQVMTNVDETRAEGTELDYWIGAATTQPAPDGFDTLDVAAGTWVVFPTTGGIEDLQLLWPRAATEWFPANPYRTAPGPEIVRVEYSDTGEMLWGELWLPVEAEA